MKLEKISKTRQKMGSTFMRVLQILQVFFYIAVLQILQVSSVAMYM